MEISNESYFITGMKDINYTINSADNKYYDYVFFMEEYKSFDCYGTYEVVVETLVEKYTVAFVGRNYGCITNSSVLDGDVLTILIDDYIVKFDLILKDIIFKKKIIDFGTGIEMYAFDNGYIINCELAIIKIDNLGNKIWSVSGRDIWVRLNGESSIKIVGDNIELVDFEENKYFINKFGEYISE